MRKLIIALALTTSAPALAAPADDFRRLLDEHWAWTLRNNPVLASTIGVRDHDGQLADISLAAQDRRAREAQAFLKRLDAIPEAQLSAADRIAQHHSPRRSSRAA